MEIDKPSLFSAASQAGINNHQAEELWDFLANQSPPPTSNKFNVATVLYYVGATLVILAMSWLMGIGWEAFGGSGILTIALGYAAIFFFIGKTLWQKANFRTPGGLFITLAVCMIPLAVYGFQELTGWWLDENPGEYQDFFSWIKGGWFLMELGTLIGGCIAIYFYRFPFLTAPIFFSLWFMSMDIIPLIFGQTNENFWTLRLWGSLWFGLGILIVAYLIDRRTKEDFAFWGYFFGMLAFWFGLWILMDTTNEFKKFLFCVVNIGLIFLSILLQRRVFLIFGALGVLGYLSVIFYDYFYDSMLFPFVLSLIGVAVIFLGVLYQKHYNRIEQCVFEALPDFIKNQLPSARKPRQQS